MKEIPITFKAPTNITDNAFRETVATALYKDGILSAYQARLIIGSTRREFEEILAKNGVAISDIDETDE